MQFFLEKLGQKEEDTHNLPIRCGKRVFFIRMRHLEFLHLVFPDTIINFNEIGELDEYYTVRYILRFLRYHECGDDASLKKFRSDVENAFDPFVYIREAENPSSVIAALETYKPTNRYVKTSEARQLSSLIIRRDASTPI